MSKAIEFVGTAMGDTIGLVIANVDKSVLEKMNFETKYRSIGIIGGSGFYSFFEESGANVQEVTIDTPYGKPSDSITIGELFGKKVA